MEGQNMNYEMEVIAARAAASYQELARVFASFVTHREVLEEKEYSRMTEHVIEKLCYSCPKQEWCMEHFDKERQEAFTEAIGYMERVGTVDYKALPDFFRKDCMQGNRMVSELNLTMLVERTKQSAFNQMMEGKEALVNQLEETAHYFQQMKGEFHREHYLTEEQKRELGSWLKRYHIRVKDLDTCHRADKGREIWMKMRCDGAKRTISMRLVERLLSEKLGFPVRECRNWSRYLSEEERPVLFCEEPGYHVMTGVARMVKEEQEISGDSFSFFYEEEGEMAMILSDGMGSGEEAAKESESVLRLLERMLSAGFREETAIRLINSVLALRAEQKMFATLDISRINLYNGTCEFIKIGGAATYLRRGKWMECVEAKTLPIGMIQKLDYDFLVKKLYDGDYIIMMSDGVLDMVPEEERVQFLQTLIGDEAGQNPQVIAGRILNASLLVQNFEPKDDMTVLVCGVFQQK